MQVDVPKNAQDEHRKIGLARCHGRLGEQEMPFLMSLPS